MSTYSGMSESGDTSDYLLYDYNYVCGFIAIAPEPIEMASLSVSANESVTIAPYSIAENTYFDKSYPIYLTFRTFGDYDYGGTFYFKISSPFRWSG